MLHQERGALPERASGKQEKELASDLTCGPYACLCACSEWSCWIAPCDDARRMIAARALSLNGNRPAHGLVLSLSAL